MTGCYVHVPFGLSEWPGYDLDVCHCISPFPHCLSIRLYVHQSLRCTSRAVTQSQNIGLSLMLHRTIWYMPQAIRHRTELISRSQPFYSSITAKPANWKVAVKLLDRLQYHTANIIGTKNLAISYHHVYGCGGTLHTEPRFRQKFKLHSRSRQPLEWQIFKQ